MPTPATNPMLSPAVQSLGLAPLQQQVLDAEAEKKKKLLQSSQPQLGPATQQLFGLGGGFDA